MSMLEANQPEEPKILSMGEKTVYPLDGIKPKLSSQSIKSILSTPIAPALHQNKPTT